MTTPTTHNVAQLFTLPIRQNLSLLVSETQARQLETNDIDNYDVQYAPLGNLKAINAWMGKPAMEQTLLELFISFCETYITNKPEATFPIIDTGAREFKAIVVLRRLYNDIKAKEASEASEEAN